MGLDYFFNNSNVSDDDTTGDAIMYFGNVYPQKKKRCFSKDKCNTDKNNKSINFYFSNKINNDQNNKYEKLIQLIKIQLIPHLQMKKTRR